MKMKTLRTSLLVIAIIFFGIVGFEYLSNAASTRVGMDDTTRISSLVTGIIYTGVSIGLFVWMTRRESRP